MQLLSWRIIGCFVSPLPFDLPDMSESSAWDRVSCINHRVMEMRNPSNHDKVQSRCDSAVSLWMPSHARQVAHGSMVEVRWIPQLVSWRH